MGILACRRKVGMALSWGAPQKLRVCFNISALAKASDFKLGKSQGWFCQGPSYHPEEKAGIA